jgi:hypothetical protein
MYLSNFVLKPTFKYRMLLKFEGILYSKNTVYICIVTCLGTGDAVRIVNWLY